MFKRLRTNSAKSRLGEERLYEIVADEVATGSVRKGIWAKAIAKSNGNKSQVESKYLELRVQSLVDEAQVRDSILQNKTPTIEITPCIEENKKKRKKKTSIVGVIGGIWIFIRNVMLGGAFLLLGSIFVVNFIKWLGKIL